jgi:pimeloyl-ACP methyl ester carboxylesterase
MPIAAVNGTELYYEVAGQGEPVVLIAGLGLDHTYYAYAIPQLTRFAKVITLDLRGVGQSARPEGPYSMRLWAEDVSALLDYLGEKRAHVVGSSLGGCVALEMVDQRPEQVASLVLVAAFSELDRSLEVNFRLRIAIVERLGMDEVLANHMMLWTLSRRFIETERGKRAADALLQSVRRNTPALYASFLRAILEFGRVLPGQEGEPKVTERLSRIAVPILLVVGRDDILTPVSFSELIQQRIPGAELAVIPDCGHITFVEQPEESARLVVEFIDRVVGRAGSVPS